MNSIRFWVGLLGSTVAFLFLAGFLGILLPAFEILFAPPSPLIGHNALSTQPLPRSLATTGRTSGPSLAPRSSRENPECNHLYELVCKKRGETRDPTGYVRHDVAGELEALRTLEKLLRDHADWDQEAIYEELAKRLFHPARRLRVETAFHWAKKQIELILVHETGNALSKREKHLLVKRVHQVQLQLPPPASLYADEPDLLTKNSVFYDEVKPGSPRIRVGGAFLATVTSWFNLVFTFAHELAHSIDPCELKDRKIKIRAYPKLISCLSETQLMRGPVKLYRSPGSAQMGELNSCGEQDPLAEGFSDWIAAQVAARALQEFATEYDSTQILAATVNTVRDLCRQEEGLDTIESSQHPLPEARIDRIFGGNPNVRELLGCSPRKSCHFERPSRYVPAAVIPSSPLPRHERPPEAKGLENISR